MNLYLVQFDGEPFYVEAQDFPGAIEAWQKHVAVAWGRDYAPEQPDSVALIHDAPVIR